MGSVRLFYLKYPQICETASHKLKGISDMEMMPLQLPEDRKDAHPGNNEICATVSNKFETPPEILISRLSFSHIRENMSIDDPFETAEGVPVETDGGDGGMSLVKLPGLDEYAVGVILT